MTTRDRRGHAWARSEPRGAAPSNSAPAGAVRCERCGQFAANGRGAALAAPCLWEWQGDAKDHWITIGGVELRVREEGELWLATMRHGDRIEKIGLGYHADHYARAACALSLGVGHVAHTWPARPGVTVPVNGTNA